MREDGRTFNRKILSGMTPREYFDRTAEQFQDEASDSNISSVTFLVAGRCLRFVFTSARLREIYATAFDHLRLPDDRACEFEPEMTLHFWEGRDHPIPPPFAEGQTPSFRGSTVEHLCDEEIQTITVPHSGMVATFDFEQGDGFSWIADSAAIPSWELFSPMRTLMNLWLVRKGAQMIHGGAVALDGKGIVFAGPSGAGKSTTSLICYQAGFDFISDDYCIADMSGDGGIRLHSLYRSARMLPSHSAELDAMVTRGEHTRTEDGKASFLLDLKCSAGSPGVLLKAILLPKITNEEKSHIVACRSSLQTWKYIAPSTLAALFGGGNKSFQLITSFVKSSPAYELHLGRDPDDLIAKLTDFLKRDFNGQA